MKPIILCIFCSKSEFPEQPVICRCADELQSDLSVERLSKTNEISQEHRFRRICTPPSHRAVEAGHDMRTYRKFRTRQRAAIQQGATVLSEIMFHVAQQLCGLEQICLIMHYKQTRLPGQPIIFHATVTCSEGLMKLRAA